MEEFGCKVSPKALDELDSTKVCDMPTLFERQEKAKRTGISYT